MTETRADDIGTLAEAVTKALENHLQSVGCSRSGKGIKPTIRSRDELVGGVCAALWASTGYFETLDTIDRALVESATDFAIAKNKIGEFTRLVSRPQKDGETLWAIRHLNRCLNKQGEWEKEPVSTMRTAEYKDRTRWGTREDAYAFWMEHEPELTDSGSAGPRSGAENGGLPAS